MNHPAVGESPGPVRFGLLGPLLVTSETGRGMEIPAAKQRAILAALLLNVNATVSADRLAELLWAASPPPSAATAVRNYVMRLRRQIGVAGARIVTRPEGYAVEVDDPRDFDVTEVARLHRAASIDARAGRWSRASEQLGAALALWRGDPLADIPPADLLQQEAARLSELRLQLTEARIDADLRLARHRDVVPELQRLTAEHPLREHLRAQLMIALYHAGRQAEALEMYRDTRVALIAELGVEPGSELRELHRYVLTGEAALVGPPMAAASPGDGPGSGAAGSQRAPWHLPAAVPGFTGRLDQLAALSRLLCQPPAAAAIAVISGSPGVGKTALAVRWAHQAAGCFPDGQLYVDLRGYGAGEPVSAADALAGLLRALGVAGPDIPDATADRAAAYRGLVAGQRILVVLDNACDSAQLRPLLPGSAAGAVLVTSRDALAGLVAREGAVRLELDPLPLGEALDLLRALIGVRVTEDPAAAAALAGHCSRLPLALRVAAELAVAHPAVSLAKLAAQLADLRDRLDWLDAGGDEQTAVRSVLSWSYRRLEPAAARAFDLLGQHPGADFDAYAAAALAGTTHGKAGRLLDLLARAYLIQPTGPSRYGLHDLLRGYACEHTAGSETEGRRAALSRLFDYYLHTASAAADTLFPARRHQWRDSSLPGACAPSVGSVPSARAWLETELSNLLAAVVTMTDDGWPGHAARLAATICAYLEAAGRVPEAVTVHGHAMRASRLAGDAVGEATALGNLGYIFLTHGRYQPAAEHLRRAITLFRQAGHMTGQANALGNLAVIDRRLARYQQAARHQARALALYRQTGDQWGEALALTRLGGVERQLGLLGQAEGHLRQALALSRRTSDRIGEAEALTRLGVVEQDLGGNQQAVEHHQQAAALFRHGCAPRGEAEALNGLGEALFAMHRPKDALPQHAAALELTERAGGLNERARAHHGLARAYQAAGSQDQARCHLGAAMNIYSQLGAPEAEQLRGQLAVANRNETDPPAALTNLR
jgi:DNA-binding SARP family transcriptional activator